MLVRLVYAYLLNEHSWTEQKLDHRRWIIEARTHHALERGSMASRTNKGEGKEEKHCPRKAQQHFAYSCLFGGLEVRARLSFDLL